MALTKEQRRARRRRIVRRAVQLSKELHAEDEQARREFLLELINKAIDIPGLGERVEKKILMAVLDLIIDLASDEGD